MTKPPITPPRIATPITEVLPQDDPGARGQHERVKRKFFGSWRITEMEVWDQDATDLLGPAHIRFDAERLGDFRFIAIQGSMHCFFDERDHLPFVEFSWRGDDDGTETCGRGWAVIEKRLPRLPTGRPEDDVLRGRIFIHQGDDSGFEATRSDGRKIARREGRTRP